MATGGKCRGPGNGLDKPKPLPPVATSYGKEGVDGSSPSEGFEKFLLISSFCRTRSEGFGHRRPPSVHRPPGVASAVPGNRVAARLCGLPGQRPPSVHGPFERERVE